MKIENGVLIDVDNRDIVDGTFIIPDSVTSIGNYAFYYCRSLTSVVIPDNVTSIRSCAFVSCSSLESVVIGNSVTSIGTYAFWNCNKLKSKEANYKAFELIDGELYCLGKRYKEGAKNSVEGELVLCKNGIHYCTNLFEIFHYYSGRIDKDIAIYEIEVGDKVLTEEGSSKCCTNSCVLKKRLYREDIIRILNGEKE